MVISLGYRQTSRTKKNGPLLVQTGRGQVYACATVSARGEIAVVPAKFGSYAILTHKNRYAIFTSCLDSAKKPAKPAFFPGGIALHVIPRDPVLVAMASDWASCGPRATTWSAVPLASKDPALPGRLHSSATEKSHSDFSVIYLCRPRSSGSSVDVLITLVCRPLALRQP
jgi:hypothetical protein